MHNIYTQIIRNFTTYVSDQANLDQEQRIVEFQYPHFPVWHKLFFDPMTIFLVNICIYIIYNNIRLVSITCIPECHIALEDY